MKKFVLKLAIGVFFVVIVGTGIIFLASPASATTLNFSEPDFEWLSTGGIASPYHLWTTGDYWRQNFTGTGVSSTNALQLELYVNAAASETLNFDVFLNSFDVGDFSLFSSNSGSQIFDFFFAPILGDDYFIELIAKNTITTGEGAYSIALDRLSSATLTAVPEPSTFLLLGGGLIGLTFAVRRRKKE